MIFKSATPDLTLKITYIPVPVDFASLEIHAVYDLLLNVHAHLEFGPIGWGRLKILEILLYPLRMYHSPVFYNKIYSQTTIYADLIKV